MSRLCVKGIGPAIGEKDLRGLFSKRGEVTDVKVMRSKSGKSRQFAFVGFRSDVQAQEAKEYFHNSFLKTSRISVEIAEKAKLKEEKKKTLPSNENNASKTKQSTALQIEEKTGNRSKQEKAQRHESKDIENSNGRSEKEEFMEMMKARKKGKSWANDSTDPSPGQTTNRKAASLASQLKGIDDEEEDISDSDSDESYTDVNNGMVKELAGSDEDEDEDEDEDKSFSNKLAVAASTSGKKRSLDAFIDSLNSKDYQDTEGKAEEKSKKEEKEKEKEKEEEEEEEEEEASDDERGLKIDYSTKEARLFVKNIPFTCSEEELRDLFCAYGAVVSVHISLDPDTKTSRGIGFVQFGHSEEAENALKELDGSSFQGRVLRITIAESRLGSSGGHTGVSEEWASTQDRWVKSKRSRKDAASGVANAAYMSVDTVVQSLAASHDVKGSDIMDVGESGGVLAVRQAIGETKLIYDNKAYFEAHGVELSALESILAGGKKAEKRSGTTILVKNLPHLPSYEDLETQFATHGELMSFLVPPSRTVALVDFVEPSDARKAFQSLAYRRYKHMPLYLEWAPLGLVSSKHRQKVKAQAQAKAKAKEEEILKSKTHDSSTVPEEGLDNSDTNTLFIRNLDFSLTKEEVESHLQSLGCGVENGLRSVQIPKSKKGNGASAGYCFVEYADSTHTTGALQKIQGSRFGTRVVEVEVCSNKSSNRGPGAASGDAKNRSRSDGAESDLSPSTKKKKRIERAPTHDATKLSIRNVAFQASEGELHSLFATFGAVKRVRLPKKMDGTHRGFGFVEFASNKEATHALNSLSSTHLYGRHLILQWAKPSDDA